MPYRFKLDEKIKRGFRRIAREQVAKALDELWATDIPAGAIHASRKAIKRLRALIRAAAPALGATVQRRHDKALRDIARRLSLRRDADVTEETISKLETLYGSEAVDGLRPLRARLQEKPEGAAEPLDAEAMQAIRTALIEEGKRISQATLKGRGVTPIIEGIAATYRDGRRALKRAYDTPTDETIHELRKMVQAHWRHMALLSRAWPDEMSLRLEAARELSQMLGDDHDLALLKQTAASLPIDGAQTIIDLCERRQGELRATAHPRAVRLYAEQPQYFAQRITIYWQSGRGLKSKSELAKPVSPEPGENEGPERGSAIGSPADLAAKTPA